MGYGEEVEGAVALVAEVLETISSVEEEVEELAAVFVRVEAVVDVGRQTRIYVAVVQLAIQYQKERVCGQMVSASLSGRRWPHRR